MKNLFDPLTLMVITLAGITVVSIISIALQNVWGFVVGIASRSSRAVSLAAAWSPARTCRSSRSIRSKWGQA